MDHALNTVNARIFERKLYSQGPEEILHCFLLRALRFFLSACCLMGFSAYGQKFEGVDFHSQVDTAFNAPRIAGYFAAQTSQGWGTFLEGSVVLSDQERSRHPGYFAVGALWNLELAPTFALRITASGAKRKNQWHVPVGFEGSARLLNWDLRMGSRIWLAADLKTQDFSLALEREFLSNISRSYSVGLRWSLFAEDQLEFLETWSAFFGVKF